jgi:hypothetical protein
MDSATTRAISVETNEALVPGGSYRFWVAFNKPMRVENAGGNVAHYAKQSPGATVGKVTVEIPSLTGQYVTLGAAIAGLGTAGGARLRLCRHRPHAAAMARARSCLYWV